MRDVDIVIPCFGQAAVTERCLQSILTTCAEQVRVLLVDNGSPDADGEVYRRALAPLAHWYCRLPTNTGFVRATNVGLAVSDAPNVLLLNNDTELVPGLLAALLEVLAREPKVGIVGPRSSSPHQWQGQVRSFPRWRLLAKDAMLSFFCALVRRTVVVQCGYLSEQYGVGLADDDDYCARVQQAQWRLALRGDTVVTHAHRTTFRAVYGEKGWLGEQQRNLKLFKETWKR
jgi:O-antigen biosynthesis protein